MKKETILKINETRVGSHSYFLCLDYHFQGLELLMSSDGVDQNHLSFIQQFYNSMPLPSYIRHHEKEMFPLLTSFKLLDHGWKEYVMVTYNIRQVSQSLSSILPNVVIHLSLHEDGYPSTYSFYLPTVQTNQGDQGDQGDGELIIPVMPTKNVTISIDIL